MFAIVILLVQIAFAKSITVYTYDSFSSKWGLGPILKEEFEKKTKAKLNYISFGSSGEALNQIALEGKKTRAEVIIGLDDSLLERAIGLEVFQKDQFVPFDYGFLGIVYDSSRVAGALPKTLKEFSEDERFRKKLALIDPRTSSVGLGFLVWTKMLYDEPAFDAFWKSLSKQVLTVSPGWSGAYGLFTDKKADFVLSYTTSPAYHIENDKTENMKALIFPEGHYKQTEYAAVLTSSKDMELAKKLMDILTSETIQAKVPTSQWMYPVNKKVALPQSFQKLPVPKALEPNPAEVEKSKKEWLKKWTELLQSS